MKPKKLDQKEADDMLRAKWRNVDTITFELR